MFKRPPKPAAVTLNLAPMVDVMMCLIIFFLLATRLVGAQYRGVELARADAARETPSSELRTRVVINVALALTGDGADYIVNVWDGQQIAERVLTPAEIAPFLELSATRARQVGEELRCVIRADRNVAYGTVEVVLRACGLAKISKIVFIAKTGEPESAP